MGPAEERIALADRLAKSLRFSNVSPAQMADGLGLTEATVESWLQCRSAPRLSNLMVWAQVCGVPFEWLTGTEEEP